MASHVATDGGTPELKSGQDGHMATSVEKGLKMKIKRKSVHSGQRHEIVSEDDAPPKVKKATKDEKQSQARLNGSNGQTPQGHQQQTQQPQQQNPFQVKTNGPPISAPESVMRSRPSDTVTSRDQGTLCSSVGIVTEPDSLGVCEPGTSVLLEGIVWQETEGGVLVVNVTWRGKTYVGTLLDATRHDWAPPRLNDDNDERNRTLGFSGRAKRTGQTRTLSGSDDNNLSKLRNGKGRRSFTPVPASPGKCSSPVASDPPKVKKPTNSDQQERKDKDIVNGQLDRPSSVDDKNGSLGSGSECKEGKATSSLSTPSAASSGKVTRVMAEDEDAIEEASMLACPEPDCHKRFKQLNGLRYHQTHAHNDRTPPPPKEPTEQDGEDQVAVSTNQQQTSLVPLAIDENETSKDSVCSNATTEKSETRSRSDHNGSPKDRKDLAKSSATCDSNTSNSVHAVDTYNNNSNGANSISADESDAQNVASGADLDNELAGGAPSPAYSDISDDNNPNTTEANGSPALPSANSGKNPQNGETTHRSDNRDGANSQTNSRPSSTGSAASIKATKPSNPVMGIINDDHQHHHRSKDLSNLKMSSPAAVVTSSASSLASMNVLGAPMSMAAHHQMMVGQNVSSMTKSGLSQPSLFPSFPSTLKLGQSMPPSQMGVPPQLMAMSHGQSVPSPRGKNTPPSQERLTPKNSSQQPPTPNQFMPQLGSDPYSFSQAAHKRMSPSVDSRRETGGPSPKPMSQGLPGPFGGPPPNMFLGGNPFASPFQAPFGLETMYHPSYMERFGPGPGVPGSAAAQGKAALDLLQQVSVAASQQSTPTNNGPSSSRPSKSKTPSASHAVNNPQSGFHPGMIPGAGKTKESPPPQRHLHTHHHTHVGMTYPPLYDPYAAAAMITTSVGMHPFVPK